MLHVRPTECRFLLKKFDSTKRLFDLNSCNLKLVGQKSPKFDFKSQFYMSKISLIILKLYYLVKIVRLGEKAANTIFLSAMSLRSHY